MLLGSARLFFACRSSAVIPKRSATCEQRVARLHRVGLRGGRGRGRGGGRGAGRWGRRACGRGRGGLRLESHAATLGRLGVEHIGHNAQDQKPEHSQNQLTARTVQPLTPPAPPGELPGRRLVDTVSIGVHPTNRSYHAPMQALVLAAGWATRLGTVTGGGPKHLLPIGPRTVIDFVVDGLSDRFPKSSE